MEIIYVKKLSLKPAFLPYKRQVQQWSACPFPQGCVCRWDAASLPRWEEVRSWFAVGEAWAVWQDAWFSWFWLG